MNQKCFYASGTVVEISDYINDVISKGWKIVSASTTPNGSNIDVIVVAEVPTVNLNLTSTKATPKQKEYETYGRR
jgi:hypothetical protein